MTEETEYVLGTDREELERLGFQHAVWVQQAYALFERAGLRAGQHVLDLGSGPGFTTFELARLVGPTGWVVACDQSPRFLGWLEDEARRLGFEQVETRVADAESIGLEDASLDVVYARWLLCWLPEPLRALEEVARVLRPGGVFVIQDYVDWGAMKLLPTSPAFDAGVAACMRSWAAGEGTINVVDLLPELAPRAGLELEHLAPVARIGAVGSLEWRWIGQFFHSYLPKLVGPGLATQAELEAFRTDWAERTRAGTSHATTPTVANVILRRPRG